MSSSSNIILPHPGLCIAAHNTSPTLAIGLATGGLLVTSADHFFRQASKAVEVSRITHPLDKACRTAVFVPDSSHLLASTSSGDVLLFDVARPDALQSNVLPAQDESVEEGPTATAFAAIDSNIITVGDDNGGLHLLDLRTSCAPVVSILEQADYISGISQAEAFGTKAVLASSGDGSLCAYDIRVPPHPRLKLQYAHDSFNDDLLSMAVLPSSNLVVAGTLSGAVNLYNMRFMDKECDSEAAAHVDRFFGHPECVNAIIPYEDAGVILTASTDGVIRVVDVVSKSLVGILEYDNDPSDAQAQGETAGNDSSRKRKKAQTDAWPVEDMVSIVGLQKPGFALLGHDEIIRFCDGSVLVDDEDKSLDDQAKTKIATEQPEMQKTAEEFAAAQSAQRRKKKKKRKSVASSEKPPPSSGFFNDL